MFQTPEKSMPLPTATSRIAGAVAGLRETARVHAQAALAMLTSILKEQRSSMNDSIKFWSRVPYFWDFLLHYVKITWGGGRRGTRWMDTPRDRNLHSGTLEIFSLYHKRSLMRSSPRSVSDNLPSNVAETRRVSPASAVPHQAEAKLWSESTLFPHPQLS